MADDFLDEFCDPNNPRKIYYDDIVAAARRINGSIVHTPLTKAKFSEKMGMEIYMKLELLQFTGSFKERGVRNALLLLTDEQKRSGVVTASDGNHAIALSYHCMLMHIPVTIVVPITTPMYRTSKCDQYHAKVIKTGKNIMESKMFALNMAKEHKLFFINGYDHPNIVEGQGTVALEILEQLPQVDAVLIPCGGGALLAGAAIALKHLKPNVEVYGIQTDKCCSMTEALRKNERVVIEINGSIAHGLAVNKVGVNTFHNVKSNVEKMIIVNEDWCTRGILYMIEYEKMLVEAAGVVGIAAIMAGLMPNLKGKKVVCIMSGGNLDTTTLSRILERGMTLEGRLVRFKITMADQPGGLAEMCHFISGVDVMIRDIAPNRTWVKGDIMKIEFTVLAETNGWDHTKRLVELIKSRYKSCHFDEPDKSEVKPSTRRGPCLAPNPVCMQK